MDAEEILKHPHFDVRLQHHIDLFTTKRPKLEKGRRYKRGPIESLTEKGLMTVENIRAEFDRVCTKTSLLSAVERAAVEDLIIYAAKDILHESTTNSHEPAPERSNSDGATST